jgi:hypothetical protein
MLAVGVSSTIYHLSMSLLMERPVTRLRKDAEQFLRERDTPDVECGGGSGGGSGSGSGGDAWLSYPDRHPAVFQSVIDWYSTGHLIAPLNVHLLVTVKEWDYWGLIDAQATRILPDYEATAGQICRRFVERLIATDQPSISLLGIPTRYDKPLKVYRERYFDVEGALCLGSRRRYKFPETEAGVLKYIFEELYLNFCDVPIDESDDSVLLPWSESAASSTVEAISTYADLLRAITQPNILRLLPLYGLLFDVEVTVSSPTVVAGATREFLSLDWLITDTGNASLCYSPSAADLKLCPALYAVGFELRPLSFVHVDQR